MMKRKTIFSAISILLCSAALTACATDHTVQFNAYWNYAVDLTPTVNTTETLTYDIVFEADDGLQGEDGYTLTYQNGVYTTKLSTETAEGKTYYKYETTLTIDVQYTYGGQSSEIFHDTTSTWVKFENSASGLRPIASHKEFVNHSPTNATVNSLDDCYIKFSYAVDTTYEGDKGTAIVIKRADDPANNYTQTNEFELDEKYTCLDNEQLWFALRGINTSLNAAPTFQVYAPFSVEMQKAKATFSTSAEAAEFSFVKDGQALNNVSISYNEITLEIPKASQKLWIAKTTDATKNEYRNVLLKMETNVAYNLGKLTYKLREANFTK